MVNFISTNPLTARMKENQESALRQESAIQQIQANREQLEQSRAADEIGREFGRIVAEPQPNTALSLATENQTAPDSYSEKLRQGIAMASGMKGGGKYVMAMAEQLQKRKDAAHAAAIKAFGDGDIGLASTLNQQHGLGLDNVFNNPDALNITKILASSQKNMKLSDEQAIAFQEAGAKKFSESYAATKNMAQAMNDAVSAGFGAARAIRPGKMNVLESQKGYFDPAAGDYIKDKSGKAVMPPDRKLHAGGGGTSKTIETMQWKSKAYQSIGIAPELADAIAANGNFATTPQAVQKQAQYLVKASELSGEPLTMAEAMNQSKVLMANAQRIAIESMGGAGQAEPVGNKDGRPKRLIYNPQTGGFIKPEGSNTGSSEVKANPAIEENQPVTLDSNPSLFNAAAYSRKKLSNDAAQLRESINKGKLSDKELFVAKARLKAIEDQLSM